MKFYEYVLATLTTKIEEKFDIDDKESMNILFDAMSYNIVIEEILNQVEFIIESNNEIQDAFEEVY